MKEMLSNRLRERGASEELVQFAQPFLDWVEHHMKESELVRASTMNDAHMVEFQHRTNCIMPEIDSTKTEKDCLYRVHQKTFALAFTEAKDKEGSLYGVRLQGRHCWASLRDVFMPNQKDLLGTLEWYETGKRVQFWDMIWRRGVRENPDKIFLFGDNLARVGYGGQAAEMRDEPNAIGIATKKTPSLAPDAFFTDEEFEANCKAIDADFALIPQDKIVVVPKAGLGTGLAQLEHRAPKTFQYLQDKIKKLAGGNNG